jgi:hypothetical protein
MLEVGIDVKKFSDAWLVYADLAEQLPNFLKFGALY